MWGTAGLVAGGLVVLLLMAEGVSMQLGGTGTMRLPQASACLKAGKGSEVFRATSPSPVLAPGGLRAEGFAASTEPCPSPSPGKVAVG